MSTDTFINIDLKLLKDNGLSPTEYCFLVCKYRNIPYIGVLATNSQKLMCDSLENRGFIKNLDNFEISLRQKFIDLIKLDTSPLLIDTWIDEWRSLFPEKVKSSGRPVRGDKKSCLKKMISFCKEYPEYSKEAIFEATRIYIFEKQRENWAYMSCADYFIYKETVKGQRSSYLASLLESIDGKETSLQILENGGDPFQKEI